MTKANMIQELANVGMQIFGERKMLKADVERYYNTRFTKEENPMTTQNTVIEVTSTNPENTPAPVEAPAPVKEKEVPHAVVAQGMTGAYTNDLEFLAHIVQDAIPEVMRTSFTIHADPKKKKLMVRWSGKSMLFKVFIQRKCYKVHLKKETDWDVVPFEHDAPFFQNGFNLPWAVKMNDDQFAQFLQWIFTTV